MADSAVLSGKALFQAELAAREMGRVSLPEALDLLARIATQMW